MAVSDERMLRLDRRLAALRAARPELTRTLDRQERLVRESLLSSRPPATPPFALPREHVAARIRQGMPLLHDQPVLLDLQFAAELFARLVNVLHRDADADLRPRLEGLDAALTGGVLDPQRLLTEAFVQHADHLSELALEVGIDTDLLQGLAQLAVAPLLRAYAERVLPMLERVVDNDHDSSTAAVWQRGYCPVCGGWPALGEVSDDPVEQVLRCRACGSSWRAERARCPYCANDDQRTVIAFTFTADGEHSSGLSVCERCTGYLKLRNAEDPAPPELLALDDLATAYLDRVAVERGYHQPPGGGYRIELAVPEEEWPDELDLD